MLALSIKDEDGNIDLGAIAESEFQSLLHVSRETNGSLGFFHPSNLILFDRFGPHDPAVLVTKNASNVMFFSARSSSGRR